MAVYGRRLAKPGSYGDRKYVSTNPLLHLLSNPFSSFTIVQLSFIIAKLSGNVQTVEVYSKCYECTKCLFLTKLLQLLLETPGNLVRRSLILLGQLRRSIRSLSNHVNHPPFLSASSTHAISRWHA